MRQRVWAVGASGALWAMIAMFPAAAFAQDKVAVPAKPLNANEWVRSEDYPPAALRAEAEGTVTFELLMTADGMIYDCNVTEPSGNDDLDAATCTLVRERAKFEPAKDAAGKPLASLYKGRVKWKLPELPRAAIADWHGIATLKLDAQGEVVGCEDRSIGQAPLFAGDPCESMRGVPPQMLERIGGQGAPQTLTIELVFAMEGRPVPTLALAAPGQTAIGRVDAVFEIAETGDVENCKPVVTGAEGKLADLPGPCENFTDKFAPPVTEGGERRRSGGRLVIALSRGS